MSLAARTSLVLVALLCPAVLTAWAADKGVTLRWKFPPGRTANYTTSQDLKVQRKEGDKPEEFYSKQTTNMTWLAESIDDDGNAHITQTVSRVRMQSKGLGKEVVFDSNDEKASAGADQASLQALCAALYQPVYLIIDPRGNVVDVRLSGAFSEKLKQVPQNEPLTAAFSRDNIKQMVNMNTLVLPDEALDKGTTWDQQATLFDPVAGKQKLVTTYRYDGQEEHDGRKLDKISATAKVSRADEKAAAQWFTVKDQKSNGVIWFDRDAGRVHEMQMITKVVREINQGANKVEETMTTHLHTRLLDEGGAESKLPAAEKQKPAKPAAGKKPKGEDL